MVLRFAALLLVCWLVYAYVTRRASKGRRRQVMRLIQKAPDASFASLSRALKHPPWLGAVLRALTSDGFIDMTMPDTFDGNSPREEQIRYRATARPRSF